MQICELPAWLQTEFSLPLLPPASQAASSPSPVAVSPVLQQRFHSTSSSSSLLTQMELSRVRQRPGLAEHASCSPMLHRHDRQPSATVPAQDCIPPGRPIRQKFAVSQSSLHASNILEELMQVSDNPTTQYSHPSSSDEGVPSSCLPPGSAIAELLHTRRAWPAISTHSSVAFPVDVLPDSIGQVWSKSESSQIMKILDRERASYAPSQLNPMHVSPRCVNWECLGSSPIPLLTQVTRSATSRDPRRQACRARCTASAPESKSNQVSLHWMQLHVHFQLSLMLKHLCGNK